MAQNGTLEQKVAQFRLRGLDLQRQVAVHEADRKWLLGVLEETKSRAAQHPKQNIERAGSDPNHPINLTDDYDHQDLKRHIPSIKQQAEWESVVSQDQDTKTNAKDPSKTPQQEKPAAVTTEQEVEQEISAVSQDHDMRTTTKGLSRTPQQKVPAAITAPNLELAFCQRFLTRMHDEKYDKIASYFHHPINEDVNKAPNYYKIIKQPIALSDIQRKLTQGEYSTSDAVKLDLDRMLDNCRAYHTYHPNSDAAYEAGKKMAHIIGGSWAAKNRWVAARETHKAQSPQKRRLSFNTEDHRATSSRTSMSGSSGRDGIDRNNMQMQNSPTKKRRLSSSNEDNQTRRTLGRMSNGLGSNARDGDIKLYMLRKSVEDTGDRNEDKDESIEPPRKTLRCGQKHTTSTLIVDVPTTDEDKDQLEDEEPPRKILRRGRGWKASAAARVPYWTIAD